MKLKGVLRGLIIGFLLMYLPVKAQYNLMLIYQIETPATFVTTDNLDNVYVVTQRNQLLKYTSTGKLVWNYSNKAFGKLSYVNATDPMRILLFYSAIQQVVVLNNNLNEISRFNFGEDSSRMITLIATSNSNGYWTYDQMSRTINKLGNQFGNELGSGNIYQQIGLAIQPSMIQATDQHVYLYYPAKGILQFDRFANFVTTINTDSISNFQVKNNNIFFLEGKAWDCYNISSMKKENLYIFDFEVLQASEGNKLMAVLTKEGAKIYSIIKSDDKK